MSLDKGKRAIILSGISWNDSYQRHHQMAFALQELGYSVYFINNIPSSNFTLVKLCRKILYIFRMRRHNIKNSIGDVNVFNLHLLWPGTGLVKYWNSLIVKLLFSSIPISFDVVIAYLPISTTFSFLDRIRYEILIYDCVRNFVGWKGYPNSVAKLEKDLIFKSSFVFCDSFYLLNNLIKISPKSSIHQILPSLPAGISPLPLKYPSNIKRLAYIGTLSSHNDLNLIKKLLNIGFVINLYGILDADLGDNFNNFIYRGYYTDFEKLQEIVGCENDAIIIPYIGNMDGVIPAKLPFVLSVGIPVFISSFYDSIHLNSIMYVYENESDLLDKIVHLSHEDFQDKYTSALNFIEISLSNSPQRVLQNVLANRC